MDQFGGDREARRAVNMTSDLDYQLSSSTVSVQFSGCESALHNVMRFEVAVGTQTVGEDELPFTLANIVHMEQPDIVCHGQWNTYTFWNQRNIPLVLFLPVLIHRQLLNLKLDIFFFF